MNITSPYQWEIYRLPNGTNSQNVQDHYTNLGRSLGFSYQEFDWRQGILILDKGYSSMQKVVIQFWQENAEVLPKVLIIYKGYK